MWNRFSGVLLVGSVVVACSPEGETAGESFDANKGDSAGNTGGTGGGEGGLLADGNGGGDTGGASGDGGSENVEECVTTSATAETKNLPADIIWAVDQSGSMNQETAHVQTQINNFVGLIAASQVDYRVVMIASTSASNSICVPPPLSGGGCDDGPRFRLVDRKVDSNDALNLIISEYDKYSDFLRPDAVKHFVVVTDDNATDSPMNSAANFGNALNGLQPGGIFADWAFHAIYSNTGLIPCFGLFGFGAAYGAVYRDLVLQTGGAEGEICTGNWQAVFTEITTSVVQTTQVACLYEIPTPDSGTVDPDAVNVEYLPQGDANNPQMIYRVDSYADCGTGGQGGWHYDNNANPTRILLCPETCAAVRGDAQAVINVKFGCESVFRPPQ